MRRVTRVQGLINRPGQLLNTPSAGAAGADGFTELSRAHHAGTAVTGYAVILDKLRNALKTRRERKRPLTS